MADDSVTKPWEDFAQSAPATTKPWEDFAAQSQPQSPGLLSELGGVAKTVLGGLNTLTESVDAPTRTAIGGLLDYAFPRQAKNTSPTNPNEAPSLTDIASKLGADNTDQSRVSSLLPEFYGDHGILGKKGGLLDPNSAQLLSIPLSLAQPSSLLASAVAPATRLAGKAAEAIEPYGEAAAETIGQWGGKFLTKNIVPKPILDSLKAAKKATGVTSADTEQIDSLINSIKGEGKVSPQRMQNIIGSLEDHLNSTGATDKSVFAAADASGVAQNLLKKHAEKLAEKSSDISHSAAELLSPSGLVTAGLIKGIDSMGLLPDNLAIKAPIAMMLENHGQPVVKSLMNKTSNALQSPLLRRAVQGSDLANSQQNQGLLK